MRTEVIVVLDEDDINNELKHRSEWILNTVTHFFCSFLKAPVGSSVQ